MARPSARDKRLLTQFLTDLRGYRRELNESQAVFWGRLGIGQSGGSRYETKGVLPSYVAMLAALYVLGYVADDEFAEVRALLAPFYPAGAEEPVPPKVVRPRLRARAASRREKRLTARPSSRV